MFGYPGAKHHLARFYSRPRFTTTVEPFAGAAGYSCYWIAAGAIDEAILIDANQAVIDLWHGLQTERRIRQIVHQPPPCAGDICVDPIYIGYGSRRVMGRPYTTTTRMESDWHNYKSAHRRHCSIGARLAYLLW